MKTVQNAGGSSCFAVVTLQSEVFLRSQGHVAMFVRGCTEHVRERWC